MHWLLTINYSWLTNISLYDWLQEAGSGECVIKVDLDTEEDKFLTGHAIDGKMLFPATGYLVRKNEIEFYFFLCYLLNVLLKYLDSCMEDVC